MTSLEEEWFTKLLKPYVHFIPVSFDVHGDGSGYSLDLAQKVSSAVLAPVNFLQDSSALDPCRHCIAV